MKATHRGIETHPGFSGPVDVWETEDGRKFAVDHGDAVAVNTGEILAEESTNEKAVVEALKYLTTNKNIGR